MNIEKLAIFLQEHKQPKFRLEQIIKAVYIDGILDFEKISNLPKDLRIELKEMIRTLPFEAEKVLLAENGLSVKAVVRLEDAQEIETVLMSTKGENWTACVSSQVGCPMGCTFCATGEGGFRRNLSAEEIVGQVLFWKNFLREKNYIGKLSNVVYMGMGEPFLNWEEVKKSLQILTDHKFLNLGARSISVSTVGMSGAIEKHAREFPQVNLAISLHFIRDEDRQKFMPAAKNYPLAEMRRDLQAYFSKSNRKVFLEYLLLKGLNDSLEDARALVEFIKNFKKPHLLHVNLIRYNETNGKFMRASHETTQNFKNFLLRERVNVTERKSLGEEIQGACGQLAGR